MKKQPCYSESPEEKHQELWEFLYVEVSAFPIGEATWCPAVCDQVNSQNALMDSGSKKPSIFVTEEKPDLKGFYCIGLCQYNLYSEENQICSKLYYEYIDIYIRWWTVLSANKRIYFHFSKTNKKYFFSFLSSFHFFLLQSWEIVRSDIY